MKKTMISLLSLLLVFCFLFGGCSNHGETMITAGDNEISVNVFQLYLSRMKGTLAAAGEKVNSEDYWNTYTDLNGSTLKDYYTDKVFDGLCQISAALMLYDDLGLELSSEEEDAIDAWIDALIDQVGEGSESTLNSVLSAYGANTTVLRDACIIEAKLEQLKAHLYGKDGSLLSSEVREEFYKMTYYRGYQMLIANYYYDHEKDARGDAIYYVTNTAADGTVTLTEKISYDKVNGVATEEKDKNGDTVYRIQTEGVFGKIAYDTKNGAIKYLYDKEGEHIVKYFNQAEMQQRYEALELIAKECKGNEALFLERAQDYSDNSDFNQKYAPNGMYFAAGEYVADSVFSTFSTELATLEIGELAILESDSGYYLLMRVDLDTGAWAKEENARWFKNLQSMAVEYMLQKRCEPYLSRLEIDTAVRDSVDITMVAANNYY